MSRPSLSNNITVNALISPEVFVIILLLSIIVNMLSHLNIVAAHNFLSNDIQCPWDFTPHSHPLPANVSAYKSQSVIPLNPIKDAEKAQ